MQRNPQKPDSASMTMRILHPTHAGTRMPKGANFLKEMHMLWTVFVILLLLWILGFSFHIAGSLIHLVLVIAVVVLIIQLITGRRAL
jgi:ABC-type uncharacterized transport system fused permease/ATPase subunit